MIALLACASVLLVIGGICGHAARWLARVGEDQVGAWGIRVPLTAAFAAAVTIVALAIRQFAVCGGGAQCQGPIQVLRLPAPAHGLPVLSLTLRLDTTAALFLLLIGACGAGIAIYSFGWLRDDPLRNHVAGSFCLFLLAMVLVIVVSNVFWLFVGLEVMTFCSADLVRYRGAIGGPVPASRTAVRTYLIVSHIALISLLIGVLPIAVAHHTLSMMRLSAAGGSPAPAFSFSFILLGLAIRAGITPFHFWVPTVHPQLPTNTHAMVSAVMLKIPIYLMLRFFLGGIIGPVQWWWGAVVLILAGLTAVVTVFYAMIATDLKVALAYHSVENIGIILAGLGLALLFSDRRFMVLPGVREAAALALLASLYHVINHGIFKSLLFMCAGSIERKTGTLELSQLGGLCRTLPWTAFSFLVGAAAIAELPPFNGFVSGWLTLQALFGGRHVFAKHPSAVLLIMPALIVALVALGLAFGATGLAFVKMSGQSLLGQRRGGEKVTGREPWSMRTIMALLAGLCLLLGLQPWLLVPWLSEALVPLNLGPTGLDASPVRLAIQTPAYHATLPVLPLLVLVGAAVGLTALLRAWRWIRRPVWVGGTPAQPGISYSGNALSALLWEPMSSWRSSETPVLADRAGTAANPDTDDETAPTFNEELRLSTRRSVPELASYSYNRLIALIVASSTWTARKIQNGDIRSYLLYMLLVVLLVLFALAIIR
jgi:hydrogenase-4 component B